MIIYCISYHYLSLLTFCKTQSRIKRSTFLKNWSYWTEKVKTTEAFLLHHKKCCLHLFSVKLIEYFGSRMELKNWSLFNKSFLKNKIQAFTEGLLPCSPLGGTIPSGLPKFTVSNNWLKQKILKYLPKIIVLFNEYVMKCN